MMREVTMYEAVCDGCGKVLESDIDSDYDAVFTSESEALGAAFDCDWIVSPDDAITFNKRYEVNDEYKLYCPDCVDWDKENECYKLKDKKQ